MRVAIYARHSSRFQENSTKDQIARCQRWCDERDHIIMGVYCDEAISGSAIVTRPSIHELIDDALNGNFNKVICEDLSRLSRDISDIASFYKKMSFLDIAIETITEGIINELHIGLKGTMNALFLKDLADKTKRGMVASVLKGVVPGGKVYGYDIVRRIENNELIKGLRKINQHEALVVQKIFKDYLNGLPLKKITDDLNRSAILSPSNKQWHPTTLIGTHSRRTGILRQTLYKGMITFNRLEFKKHPETGKRVSTVRPESEWIYVPVPELAIFDESYFDHVQTILDEQSKNTKHSRQIAQVRTDEERKEKQLDYVHKIRSRQMRKNKLLLTTRKLHCPICLKKMISIRSTIYGCPNKNCHNRNIHRPQLLNKIQQEMEDFNTSHLIEGNKRQAESIKKLNTQKSKIQKKLIRKQNQIKHLLDQLGQGQLGKETLKYLDDLELECLRLNLDLKKVDTQLNTIYPLDENDIQTITDRLLQLIQQNRRYPDNPKIIKRLYPMIDKITVTKYKTNRYDYDLDVNIIYKIEKIVAELRIAY